MFKQLMTPPVRVAPQASRLSADRGMAAKTRAVLTDRRTGVAVQRQLDTSARSPRNTVQLATAQRVSVQGAIVQRVKDPPTEKELNASVAAYKALEADAAQAKATYQAASSKLDKEIAARHKAGNPMPAEEQLQKRKAVESLRRDATKIQQNAQAARNKSDRLHNAYRNANPAASGTARYGNGQQTMHQGAGSVAKNKNW
ncbi:MAG: hypothetical protein ACOVN0_05120 [Niveispirillum sp.]|uniref:hypothetical protein n=1 Tax=Niveispirillum sp. TaxID=1917217 RepID=UPI003BA7C4A8